MGAIEFRDRVVIVTGSGRGIGRTYALELAKRGAKVVVNDFGPGSTPVSTRAEDVASEIIAAGGNAIPAAFDVASAAGGQAITDVALDAYGTVDAVINNAGILRRGMFEDVPAETIAEVLNVHLLGSFNVTQPAWRVMKSKGYGRIVFTSSSAIFGMEGNACYSAAKAGIIGLVQSLAMEADEQGIKVNGLIPFAISPMAKESPATAIPARDAAANVALQKALADRSPPESVAAATLYLASEACAVSGLTISAMAGRFARLSLNMGQGWLAPDMADMSPECVGINIEQITSTAGAKEMTRMTDEFHMVRDMVAALEAKQ